MLFKFGKFWRTLSWIIGSWTFYGIFGFEFTVITLLALIAVFNIKDKANYI